MTTAPGHVAGTGIISRFFYLIGRILSFLMAKLYFRARYYGRENLPATGGGLILSNHQSYMDPSLIGVGSPRQLRYFARDTLFKNPLFGFILKTVGAVPVKRGQSDRDAIRQSIEILKHGHLLVMFPEGTRTADGAIKPFKGGFRLLASRGNVPIIPVAIHGMYEAWPRTNKLPRPRPVRVMYGTPIPPEEFASLSDEDIAEKVHKEISSLLEKLRGLT